MAESLGAAVLTVTVDDQQLKAGLQAAERQFEKTGSASASAFNGTSQTLTGLTSKLNTLQQELQNVGIGTAKFRELNAEIIKTQRTIDLARSAGGGGANAAGTLALVGRGLGAASATAAIATAAVAGIGYAATQSAGSVQKLQAAFTGLTGSAEAAKQLRQQLFDLSKTTPFRNEEILQAAQRFLAVGINVNALSGSINRVGALAAQSGQPLERLALIYAQVYAKGRLQGEENMQLLEAGVDLSKQLTQVTGLSGTALQDAMSKGKIGVAEVNKAITLATGNMSALQQAGQAVDIQFNNIGDNAGQVFAGFAQVIAPALSAAFGVINQVFEAAFPSLDSITNYFAPLTASAQEFAAALQSNPQAIQAIAESLKSLGGVLIQNVADGLLYVSDLLNSIDGQKFVDGLLNAELVIRRLVLGASALGAQLVKNAELSLRAASNPIQFGKDIVNAGGIGAFLDKEFEITNRKWKDWANSRKLELGSLAQKNATPMLSGNLDSKVVPQSALAKQNLIDAYDAAARSAEKIAQSAEQAKASLLALQASPDQGLNQYLDSFGINSRRAQAGLDFGPTLNKAIQDANDLLSKQGLAIPEQMIKWLRRQSNVMSSTVVGEINGRQIISQSAPTQMATFEDQMKFFNAVQNELNAAGNVQDTQAQLAKSLQDLVAKDWSVQVNIGSDGSAAAYGDVLNGALAQ